MGLPRSRTSLQLEADAIATAIEQIVAGFCAAREHVSIAHPDLHCLTPSVSDSITEVLSELREALENTASPWRKRHALSSGAPWHIAARRAAETVQLAPSEIDAAVADVQVAAWLEGARQLTSVRSR
jgi:hypothetical protein